MIGRSILLLALCGLATAACQSSDGKAVVHDSLDLKAPVYAYASDLGGDKPSKSLVVSGGKSATVDGTPWGFLPNGSILLDRYAEADESTGKPSFIFDPTTGAKHPGSVLNDLQYGSHGQRPHALLEVHQDGRKLSLGEYDFTYAKKREVTLPGLSPAGPDDGNSGGTSYGQVVGSDSAVFVTRTDFKGIESTADAVVRIDAADKVTQILKNRHISNLTLASDQHSIVASVMKDAPYYEGLPAVKDIVELNPKTGAIKKSYGLPPPCVHFEPVTDSASCLDRVDKFDGVVAVSVYESTKPAGTGFDGYSTWTYKAGKWSEAKAQRGKLVYWQSRNDRIEGKITLDFGDSSPKATVVWWHKATKHVLPNMHDYSIRDWAVPGSLIRPAS